MTSLQAGISCDYCKKNNFRGLRYKCLICHDFDLCSTCYEAGLVCSRHNINHAMQCIVAKDDFELFYSGETLLNERPQSLTCPLCGTLGFDEATLIEHVTNEHPHNDSEEIPIGAICPICGSETNQLTFDFHTHLTMEHRSQRDPLEHVGLRGRGRSCHARTAGPRGRRTQAHYNAMAGGAGSSPSSVRDSADPLVEILAQLSGVRRPGGVGNSNQSPASQLHQLQMHLQSSPSFSSRSNDVRIMRRTFQSMSNQMNASSAANSANGSTNPSGPGASIYSNANGHYCSSNQPFVMMDQSSLGTAMVSSGTTTTTNGLASIGPNGAQSCALVNQAENSSLPAQYLLPRYMKPALSDIEQQEKEILKADRSLFVQELILQIGLLEKDK